MLRGVFSVVLCLGLAGLSMTYGQERCADKLNKYNQDQEMGRIMPGRPVPRCDENGNYGPIQCVGSICHCANINGQKLYSPNGWLYKDNAWEQSSMDCRCARDEHNHQRSGQSGRIFSCRPNGSY